MSAPLVSLLVPTRNRASSLQEAIETICGQDYAPLEIIISDNASDDGTEALCRDLAAKDSRVRYIRHDRNIGLHGNHNFCFDQARGDYLGFCHDHDVRAPTLVRAYVEFLEAHPRVGAVCADWDLIDDAGRQLGVRSAGVPVVTPGLEYIDRTIRTGRTSLATPGAMVRRVALGDIRFVLDAPIGFGDFPIWCQVAERWDIGHIDQRLWSWRQNEVSHSARPIEVVARDYDANLSAYCHGYLTRWPGERARVDRWRTAIRRYLFWALGYEVALHFRDRSSAATAHERSLFEIMDYRLSEEQFRRALDQMRGYRAGPLEYLSYAVVATLVKIGMTAPLAWASRHQASARTWLGLR